MDLSTLAAAPEAAIITESFLKWVCGGMGGAIIGLCIYIKSLLDKREVQFQKQVDDEKALRREVETDVRNRFLSVIAGKDKEIDEAGAEVRRMREEKFAMLEAQVRDGTRQQLGFEELSKDYETLVKIMEPLVGENIKVLNYYRERREAQERKRP